MGAGQHLLKGGLVLAAFAAAFLIFGKGSSTSETFSAEQQAAVDEYTAGKSNNNNNNNHNNSNNITDCPNCELNSACFNETANLWLPEWCGKQKGKGLTQGETAAAAPEALFIGDSNIRQLFAGVVQARLGKNATIIWHGLSINGSENGTTITLFTLKRSNLKTEEELQADFFSAPDSTGSLSFLWNPLLNRSMEDIKAEIQRLKPKVVVFGGAGLRFLTAGMDINQFRAELEKFTVFLVEESKQSSFKVVYYQQTMPLNFDHGLYNATAVEDLVKVSSELFSLKYPNDVVLFDSHLAAQKIYVELCQKFNFPDITTNNSEWMCNNANQTGFVVIGHFAMLLEEWMLENGGV